MERLYNLAKGNGKGKKAAIISITARISFKSKGIKNVIISVYKKFLEKYCGYDRVYILANEPQVKGVDLDYFDPNDIVYDIYNSNILNDLCIDDVFCCQNTLVFFGGLVKRRVFAACNYLLDWYKEHGDGHYYTIQDDPEFCTINPMKYIEKRIELNNIKLIESEETTKYLNIRGTKDFDLLNQCFDNTILAHCGTNYPVYFEAKMKENCSAKNQITEPKYWDQFNVYTWQGVNCNLDDKLIDYPYPKQYISEYHGYVKHDLPRIKTTISFYNALEAPIKVIQGKKPFSTSTRYDFNHAETYNEVKYNQLFEEIAKYSCSTLITASKSAFNDFISPRYFDTMLADIIPFVYLPYDENKTYTDDDELKEFMYVNTPEEFKSKVDLIANDENYYRHIKYLQRKSIYDKFNEYMLPEAKQKFEDYLSKAHF